MYLLRIGRDCEKSDIQEKYVFIKKKKKKDLFIN